MRWRAQAERRRWAEPPRRGWLAVAGTRRQDQHQDGQHRHRRCWSASAFVLLHTVRCRCALPRASRGASGALRAVGHLAQNPRHHTCSLSRRSRSFADRSTPRRCVSSPAMHDLPDRVRLVIFDLDGVVYRGDETVPGAPELVAWLHEARRRGALRDEQLDGRARRLRDAARRPRHPDRRRRRS